MFIKECSVVLCASILCFCVGLSAAQESAIKEPAQPGVTETAHRQKEVLIKVTTGSREFQVSLNSTPEAKLFYSQLPLSVSMGRFGGREFYGRMPGEMKAGSNGQYTFKDGTLTYCPTNHTVAFFYAQTSRPNLTMAVYPMGSVLGNLNFFHELDDSVTFHFSK